jgi:hypothetical protein
MGKNTFYQTLTLSKKIAAEFVRFQSAGYLLPYESGQFISIKGNFEQIHRQIFGKNPSFSGRGNYHLTCCSSNRQAVYFV